MRASAGPWIDLHHRLNAGVLHWPQRPHRGDDDEDAHDLRQDHEQQRQSCRSRRHGSSSSITACVACRVNERHKENEWESCYALAYLGSVRVSGVGMFLLRKISSVLLCYIAQKTHCSWLDVFSLVPSEIINWILRISCSRCCNKKFWCTTDPVQQLLIVPATLLINNRVLGQEFFNRDISAKHPATESSEVGGSRNSNRPGPVSVGKCLCRFTGQTEEKTRPMLCLLLVVTRQYERVRVHCLHVWHLYCTEKRHPNLPLWTARRTPAPNKLRGKLMTGECPKRRQQDTLLIPWGRRRWRLVSHFHVWRSRVRVFRVCN